MRASRHPEVELDVERHAVGETLNEAWQRLSQQQPVQLPDWQWLVLAVAVALLVLPRPVWRFTGMYCTLVHELGHVFSALLTGRYVTGLRLGWDHSGEVVSRGRGKLSVIVSGSLGYPAPIWCAAGLLAITAAGHAGLGLGIYAVLFCLALVFVRNLPALLVCLASALAAVAVAWFAPPAAFNFTALLLAGFLLVAGLRDCVKLLSVHTWRRNELRSSDAYLIARATGGLATGWLLLILALAAGGTWVAVGNLVAVY